MANLFADIFAPAKAAIATVKAEVKAQKESDKLTQRDGEAEYKSGLPGWLVYAGAAFGILYLLKKRKRKRK